MFYFCIVKKIIGLWCNGNTTDSGPVILGSNPGSPTKATLIPRVVFFVCGGRLHEGSLATTAKQDAHVLMQASAMYPCLSQRCCPHATVVSIVI